MPQKTALIIGGSSGIGLGIAEQLSLKGIRTIVVGRRNLELKSETPSDIKYIQVDLTAPNSIAHIQKEIDQTKLDYIVFSAATEIPLNKFAEITPKDYDYAFTLNLKIPFFLAQSLLNNLNQNARLLFLTSRLSSSPEIGSLVYCMTKSAIEVFSTGLKKELSKNILASSIIPGVVDTEMQKRLREADPKIFPSATVYNEMTPRLQEISMVSKLIVSHLCDSDDETYATQRVNINKHPQSLTLSKL